MKRSFALISLFLLPVLAFGEAEKAVAKKVRLKTNLGSIVIELSNEKAPITVANFLGYVNRKHHDGTVFHRVIDGFMIQGGGFAREDKDLVEKPVGPSITNEGKNGLKNVRGSIAMARTSDPDSATSQFFINVADNAMLDFPNNGGYAVFGKVVEGMDVVDKIKSTATGTSVLTMRHPASGNKIQMPATDVPKQAVVIQSASAE